MAVSRSYIRKQNHGGVQRTDKVSVLEVEAVQLLEGVLRVHRIPEDDIGGSLRVDGDALADLTEHALVYRTQHYTYITWECASGYTG